MTSPKAITFITADHDKGRHAVNIFRGRYDVAKLDEDEAQRFNDAAPELKQLLDAFIAKVRVPQDFSKEEVKAAYGYPNGHIKVAVPQQIAMLIEVFPGLVGTQALELAKRLPKDLPTHSEQWLALPKIEAIGRLFFAEIEDEAERYCAAVNLVLDKIAESRAFTNWRSGQITKDRLRQRAKDKEMLAVVEASQPGDIVIIEAQLGKRHGGRSVRRARAVFLGNEFGLGAFHVGCVVLTHPKRLQKWEELDMDCPGDEFDETDSDDRFDRAPFFHCDGGEVKFDTFVVSGARDGCGSVSGFPPQ